MQIAAGVTHSLALRRDGKVLAWGDNSEGQLDIPEGFRAHIPGHTAPPVLELEAPQGPGGPQIASLTSADPDAEIRYTLDGSEPDETSPLYTGPIHLGRSATLRAITLGAGLRSSALLQTPVAAALAYHHWAAHHQLTPGDDAPTADPHGRGLTNLQAYALGLAASPQGSPEHPWTLTTPAGQPLHHLQAAGESESHNLQLTFPYRRDSGLLYEALFSDSPAGPWQTAPLQLEPLDHHWSRATATDPVPTQDAPHRFGRLRITKESEDE